MAAKQHNPAFEALVESLRTQVSECTIDDVRSWQQAGRAFFFVDVREDHEFAQDHATGSMHIGRGVIERDVETLIPNKAADVVLYCGGGYRSVLAADSLQKMGYTNVRSMIGGIRAWREASLPLTVSGKAPP